MNVFVVGTGRCGTTTLTRALQHASNFTVSHESKTKESLPDRLDFPPGHIEVDPRLSFFLPLLETTYADRPVLYVHLLRNQNAVVDSFVRRGISPYLGPGPLVSLLRMTPAKQLPPHDYRQMVDACVTCVNGLASGYLSSLPSERFFGSVFIEQAPHWLPDLWQRVGADGSLGQALLTVMRRHNAS